MSKDTDNAMRFSLVLETVPITLVSVEGQETEYELREMDGKKRDSYMNRVRESVLINPKGEIIGFKTFDGIQSSLLSFCLFLGDAPVEEEKIQTFPTRVLEALFDKAQEMNRLVKKDPEKNDLEESGSTGSE